MGGLVAVLGGAVAAIAAAARADGQGGFQPMVGPGERPRRPTDAHPVEPR